MKNYRNVRNYETNEKCTKAIDTWEMKTALRISHMQGDGQPVHGFNVAKYDIWNVW